MSELVATLHETLMALANGDPRRRRFGAARHQYRLAPPIAADAVAAIESVTGPLPDDLRELAPTLGGGGAGPYHGLLPLATAAQRVYAAAPGRAMPIADVGCGYAAVIVLQGTARGEIWLDAPAVGVTRAIAPSFAAFYFAWIERLALDVPPDPLVPPGACALAHALGGYLGLCERRLGLPAGTIAGDALRTALAELGPGAIAIAAERSPLFADGTRVDPCLACATLLEHLGLPREVVTG